MWFNLLLDRLSLIITIPFYKRLLLRSASLVFVALILFIKSSPALALNEGTFCHKNGQLTWYVAFGTTVFNFLPKTFQKNYYAVVDRTPKNEMLLPIDKIAPVGCFENPEQLRSLMVYFWPPLGQKSSENLPQAKITFFQMYRHYDGPNNPNNPDSPASISNSNTISCKFYHFQFRQRDQSVFCANDPSLDFRTIPTHPKTAWMFYSSKNSYSTYRNEPLAMDWNNFENLVSVRYVFNSNILIAYKWSIPKQKTNFGSEYLIDLDRALQAKLNSFIVEDYPWKKP